MTSLDQVFADSAGRAASSLPVHLSPGTRERAFRSIGRRRTARAVGASAAAVLVVGGIATGVWASAHSVPAGPTPTPSTTGRTSTPSATSITKIPGVPAADVEFRLLAETYPSVWDALGLQGVTVKMDFSDVAVEADGSVLFTETRAGGGARIGRREPGGAETPLTGWLSTDAGQQWQAVTASGTWLVYADNAGSHLDSPTTAPGIVLLDLTTGATDVVTTRKYSAPRAPCAECADWMYVTNAQIAGDRLYWIDTGPDQLISDRALRSIPLTGGASRVLLTGDYQFDDPSCVTTPGADVRVSGNSPGAENNADADREAWDIGGDGTVTLATPAGGLHGGAGNVRPSTCAGVDIAAWYTPLDGSPLPKSISGSAGAPPTLLNAIDIIRPGSRARVRLDDDFGLPWVTSQVRGWVVIEQPRADPALPRFVLLDTQAWRMYEVTAPAGTAAPFVTVHGGRVWVYFDADLSQGTSNRDSVLSAALP
jgi:hypothetical protein